MKFLLLIKGKMVKKKHFLAQQLSDAVFILLINFKMPTIVGILIFMSRIDSCSAELSMKKVCNLGAGCRKFSYYTLQ